MKVLTLVMIVGVAVSLMDSVRADEAIAQGETRALLAEHETIATFEGIAYRKCLGRTAMCPERCGDSGEYATFTVVEYTRYKQHGKYGGKQTSFTIQVSDFHKKPKGDPGISKTVRSLKKGDRTRLWWRHDYVTKNGASFPERPILKLEAIDNPPDPGDGK